MRTVEAVWGGMPVVLLVTLAGAAGWALRAPVRRRTPWHALLALVTAAWCGAVLVVIGVMSWQPGQWATPLDRYAVRPWSVLPLRAVWRALEGKPVTTGMWEQMGGNLLLLAPLGVLLPLLTGARPPLWRATLLAASASLALELLQLAGRFGIADIDDLLLNTTGAVLAYAALRGAELSRWRSSGPWRPSPRRTP